LAGDGLTAIQIARKLGGRRVLRQTITSDLELAEAVRAGLPSGALDHVFDELSGFLQTQRDVYDLVGSARTLQRKRSRNTSLSAGESDRLARFARFLVRAEEAIGDRTKALRWLIRPNRALGGEQPLKLLDSDAGAVAVERVLGRIEHGVYS
jgi:putative toxin-antitoxin system antitoxin component (TIGR02293 family)